MHGEDAAPPLSFATRHGPRQVGAVARFTSKRLAGGHDGAELGRDALGPERDQPPAQRDELGAVLSFSGALLDAPDRGHLGSVGETFQLGILIWSRMRVSFQWRSMAASSGET